MKVYPSYEEYLVLLLQMPITNAYYKCLLQMPITNAYYKCLVLFSLYTRGTYKSSKRKLFDLIADILA